MNEQTKDVYKEAIEFFNGMQEKVRHLEESTRNVDDMIDAIYGIRETIQYIEDVRKSLNSLSEFFQQVAYLAIASNHRKSWATDYASGKLEAKPQPSIPSLKKNRDEYLDLCRFFGIPASIAELDVFRLHWPGIVEYCRILQEKGEDLPTNIDNDSAKLAISVRKKKGILDD